MSKEVTLELDVKKAQRILQAYQNDIYEYTREEDNNRKGKLLTLIESVIPNENQCKAVKDMVHEILNTSRPYQEYPQLRKAVQAIGFELYDEIQSFTTQDNDDYNKYVDNDK